MAFNGWERPSTNEEQTVGEAPNKYSNKNDNLNDDNNNFNKYNNHNHLRLNKVQNKNQKKKKNSRWGSARKESRHIGRKVR